MNHLITLILLLPFILAPSACVDVKAEVPVETPAIPETSPTPENPGMSHEDEMRFTQVIMLINQLCTDEGINKECRSSVLRCYGKDIWAPTPAVLKCFEEWGKP